MGQCPKCGAEAAEEQAFCENCGRQLRTGVRRRRARRRRSLADRQHAKHIRSARGAIMVVSVLTFIGGAFQWYTFRAAFEAVGFDVDPEAAAYIKALLAIPFIVGFIYLGLFFWAKTNPFGAALTALVIFATNILVSAAIEPSTIVSGLLVRILIIVALVSGVRSGLAFKKLKRAR